MADSPPSSDLSDPPSAESEGEERLSTAGRSSRPSIDMTHTEHDSLPPPSKRRKTAPSTLANFDRAPSSQPGEEDDNISISSDGFSSAPGSPDEYALRDEAQTQCLWKNCEFGEAANNDELVKHVQGTHCATGGPKKTKYVCEWGECQRKTSNHPSGYALKAHMRSHTKEKPYYCALPECDKAFTRSDALAKHMRTVHEPEPARAGATGADAAPSGSKKSSIKIKLTNGSASTSSTTPSRPPAPPVEDPPPPDRDEDGNPVTPSPANDNISYTPAHHPITGAPGFMITYPPDIHFTAWESAISADQLMRLLRRQLHWAQEEGEKLKAKCHELEGVRKGEWELKELLLDGVLESELARGEKEGLLRDIDERVKEAMEKDVEPAKGLEWSHGVPAFRSQRTAADAASTRRFSKDVPMEDAVETPPAAEAQRTPSPPPTGHSNRGFDGDADPYDNYVAELTAAYEERERLKSLQNTPHQPEKPYAKPEEVDQRMEDQDIIAAKKAEQSRQAEAEAAAQTREKEVDALDALMDMSGVATGAGGL